MLLPVAWWNLVMPALSALSDTLCPDVGLKLWNRPLSGFRWRASSCETDHYWVLMTGLKLWNRPLPGFWWRASSCETDHYCYLGFRWRASPLWDLCIWLHGQYVCRMNLETCTSVSGRLNRNINNDDTNETGYKTRKTFQLWKEKKLFNCQLPCQYTTEVQNTAAKLVLKAR